MYTDTHLYIILTILDNTFVRLLYAIEYYSNYIVVNYNI